MKNLILALALPFIAGTAFAGGSMIGGGDGADCDLMKATEKAHDVADFIAATNGYDLKKIFEGKIVETADYYEIPRSYDLGLSVPTYTVRIRKDSCLIFDVLYNNNEG